MSHLFIAHAKHGKITDDTDLLHELDPDRLSKLEQSLGLNRTALPLEREQFDFHPAEARTWSQYSELKKCRKVMAAQEIFRVEAAKSWKAPEKSASTAKLKEEKKVVAVARPRRK